MLKDNRPFTWTQFAVQFACGALLGGLIGYGLACAADNASQAWPIALATAAIVGLFAGFFGDRFWDSFGDSLWNPFRWLF